MLKRPPKFAWVLRLGFSVVVMLSWALTLWPVAPPRRADRLSFSRPQRLVTVAGVRYNLHCAGSGSPTVILEPALGEWSYMWTLAQPRMARATRTCSYDRAGLGFSSAGPLPRTAPRLVGELHALLRTAGIEPPYVMAGVAEGATLSRLFAATYPAEVQGLVLFGATTYDADFGYPDPPAETREGVVREATRCRALAAAGLIARDNRATVDCVGSTDRRLGMEVNRVVRARWQQPAVYDTFLSEVASYDAGAGAHQGVEKSLGTMPVHIVAGNAYANDVPLIRRYIPHLSAVGLHHRADGPGRPTPE